MPRIMLRDNEPPEVAIRRFKRACEKAGLYSEMRERERYEKPTEARKRAAAAAVKRHHKQKMRENPAFMARAAKTAAKRVVKRGERTTYSERSN